MLPGGLEGLIYFMQTSIFWSFPESGNWISGSISFRSSVRCICPICCFQWINPAQPLSTQQPFLPAGAGRESEEKKRKTHGSRWQFSKWRKGKKKEQRYKNYNSPLPTSRLTPSWSPSKGHFGKTSPNFIGQHDVMWHGTSFWTAGVICPSCVTSQPLVHPQSACCRGRVRNRESRDAVQALLRDTQNISLLSK